ncbi:DJ-1/PfpI family protein [Streptomyces zhaozhouensis]|uniref:DJ-1/PfpI family protein n=1 Tax=Streptomyces zhaozhouensis TaxID=1300267 RepID=A0A286DUH0_9ACTN|nr:DJ-1/PfpI family protein [Streptomyces zhaozhouensis]SOD62253.1 DJ-1/PfpI family protein [Streptomyces zhaozhouensis]
MTTQKTGVPRRTDRRALLGATVAAAAGSVLAGAAPAAAGARPSAPAPEPAPLPASGGGAGPRVGVLLYEGFSLLDPTGPSEVLSRLPGASVTMIGEHAGPVRTDTRDVAVLADASLDEVDRLDVLLVPGGGLEGTVGAIENPRLREWIGRVHRRTRWTTSVCTGSLILAAAGLLTGRRATTHWASAEYIEDTYGVTYVPERYVRSGRILTAAGVSAGIDLALHLAAELTDERTARAIQLAIEYDPAPPFDSGDAGEADQELKDLALRLLSDSAAR